MKIIYICHPIGGNVEVNLAKISEIVSLINRMSRVYIPFVPYYADCVAMDDADPDDRARGILNDMEFFERKCINGRPLIDELWVFGEFISNGMKDEIKKSLDKGIRVKRAFILVMDGDKPDQIIIRDFEVSDLKLIEADGN